MPRKTPSKKSPKKRSTKGSTDDDEPSTSLGTVFRESGGLAAIVAAAAVGVKAGYAHYVLLVLVLYVVTNEGRRNAVVHWWCRALRPFTPNQRRAFWLLQFLSIFADITRYGPEFKDYIRNVTLDPWRRPQLVGAAWLWCEERDLSLFAPPSGKGALPLVDLLARRFTDVPLDQCRRRMTLVGWVTGVGHLLGVVGVFPRLSALIAGSSLLFLQALHQLGSGSNHRWLLPSLSALCLSIDNRKESYGRRLLLVLTVAIFASAGYMKLCNGPDCSMEWASGASLRWSLAKQNPVESGLYMRELLRDSTLLARLASISTLIVECGAPLALLATPKIRNILCWAWAVFHVNIFVAMPNVNYLPSAVVYTTLLVDWGPPPDQEPIKRRGGSLKAILGCLVIGAATITTATRSQAWPFTCLPMFSPRRDSSWSKECMTLNQTRTFMHERHATTMASRQWASVLLTWYDPVDHVILHGPFADGGHELRKYGKLMRVLSAELRYQEAHARSYDGGRAPAAFALDDAILADASSQESLATYCAYANATDELARCASIKHRLNKTAAPSEKPKPKAVLVAASLTHRQCGPEGPRDAVVAVRRVDGAAPCSVPGGALQAYWTADAENVPEGREPALDVTRAFCQHLTGISRYY